MGEEGEKVQIVHGDSLEVLRGVETDSVDVMVTDPPYGISFMGRDWDKVLVSVEHWRECLRVLKPGAFAFVMSSPRQDVLSRMIVRMGEAGFETGFTSIYWTYATGFPKAGNLSKMADKRQGAERQGAERQGAGSKGNTFPLNPVYMDGDPVTVDAKSLQGAYAGFQPKPALEVVIVAMKPLSEATYLRQALANGKGCSWLDEGRIPLNTYTHDAPMLRSTGRFPANLLVEDDVLDDGVERLSSWGHHLKDHGGTVFDSGLGGKGSTCEPYLGDRVSFSRYFRLDAWWDRLIDELPESVRRTFPFLICPKAGKGEKNEGCGAVETDRLVNRDDPALTWSENRKPRNNHPTVKPLKLMSWLVTIGSRPGDLVLDPFLGSGTTAVAARMLGRRCLGIEREEEYVRLARARVEAVSQVVLPMEKEG